MKFLSALFLLLTIFLMPQDAEAVTCSPGEGFNGSGCSVCLGGYYSDGNICNATHPGYFSKKNSTEPLQS